MPRSYPSEFRRKVLDLIAAGRTVAAISGDLGVSGQTIYSWRKQDQVDRGQRPGVTSSEQAELAKARSRIAELETELAAIKRANELLKQVVSDSGLYAWLTSVSHAWRIARAEGARRRREHSAATWAGWPSSAIVAIIRVHHQSNGTYGALRVHAELTLGRGITMGHNAVEMLIRRAKLQGLPGARRRR